MGAVTDMLANRPAVVANLLAFMLIATAERGWLRMGLWLGTGTGIGWLMEFSSTRNGFPFGTYYYHVANFPDDLWIAGVPLFASLSFAALTYLGYSAAYTMLSPLRQQGADVQRIDDRRRANSVRVLCLAAIVITWMDMVIDPVTHLGRYWWLGDLYHYEPPGLHFDVPLSNYAGWLLTAACIVFTNQSIDRGLGRLGSAPVPGFHLPFKPFWSIACELGTYLYMLGVTLYLMGSERVPGDTPLAGILTSGVLLTVLYLAFVVAMVRRGFARSVPERATATPTEQVQER